MSKNYINQGSGNIMFVTTIWHKLVLQVINTLQLIFMTWRKQAYKGIGIGGIICQIDQTHLSVGGKDDKK